MQANIHAFIGIRSQNPSVQEGEEIHALDRAVNMVGYTHWYMQIFRRTRIWPGPVGVVVVVETVVQNVLFVSAGIAEKYT
jgi:hypothetical protein